MKQLLFLLLFPCLALAQYTGNAGQKITLGEQTTADGLVYRGVANIDTVAETSKITRANKQDTSTFILLDTVTNLLWHYKTTSNRWLQAGGSTLDTATMLLPYYRNGRALGTPSSGVLTSATGLPIATGLTGLGAATRIPFASSATALTTSSSLTFTESLGRLTVNGINTSGSSNSFQVNNSTPLSLFTLTNTGSITVRGIGNIVYNGFSAGENRYQLYSNGNTNNPLMFYINGGAKGSAYAEFSINGDFNSNEFQGGGLYFDTRDIAPPLSIMVKNKNVNPIRSVNFYANGTVGIGTDSPQSDYRLHVVDSVYVGGNVSASAYTTRSDYELKDEIQNISYGINEVMQMQPVKYTYKSNGSTQLGFIAQDLGVITPEVVSFEDKMSVYYNALIPILTKAIQEQQALIKALEQRILILENK